MRSPGDRRVRVVPVGPPSPDARLVRRLVARLERWPGMAPVEDPPLPLEPEWWDSARGQLSSNQVVDALIERHPPTGETPPGDWMLGLTAADLFAPGRSFVFGEAARGGSWALLSLARLGSVDSPELEERLLKEAVHELGHLAGLDHCPDPACVMSASADVEDVDRKGAWFCDRCEHLRGLPQRP